VVKDAVITESIDGRLYAVIQIDVTVKKYKTLPDREFKIEVRGLRSHGYKKGENVEFSVNPNKDGYLKIFIFEDADNATQLFPNDHEKDGKLTAKKTVNFPTLPYVEYPTEKNSDQKQEHNVLVFVYTKSDIPFYGKTTRNNILSWLNNIEPDQREVVMESIMITE
jgi:hypothetical protein